MSNVRLKPVWTPKRAVAAEAAAEADAAKAEKDKAFQIASGGLKANIMSGPLSIGVGIKNLPTFFGKGVQTAAGLTELTSPAGQLKLVKGDSRLTADWQEGKELGLEGEALVAYSLHRQLPLAGDYINSATATGRSLAELATLGRYDAGEEGIDYANAWREGRLGAKIVEDAGNIILAGRLGGAGNVIARGGQAVTKAGAPRLGGVITTTGRFVEEPIGTAARGVARGVEGFATTAGRPNLAEAAGRVAAANVDLGAQAGPLRQAVSEATLRFRQRASNRWDEIQGEIVKLRDEQETILKTDPRSPRIAEIADQIKDKQRLQERVLVRAGVPKRVRQAVTQGQELGEAYRASFQQTAARFVEQGVEVRKPEALRASAQRRLDEAARLEEQGDPVRASALREMAAQDNQLADLQEQFPGVLNAPVPKEASPVAHIIIDNQVPLVIEMANNGLTPQQIADNLTSPMVAPDIEMRGYRYTADDVQYLLDYLNGRLNPAQIAVLQAVYTHYAKWSEWFTAQQMAGRGRAEPLTAVARQTTPDPRKLIEFIDRYGRAGKELEDFLDNNLLYMVQSVAPDLLKTMNIDPKNPAGIFRKFASTNYNTPMFKLANATIINNFDQILANPGYGYIFRSPDVYPPNMRREVEAEERFLAGTRAEAVQEMLDGLRTLSEQFGDILDKRTLDAITARIAKLENTPAAFDPVQYKRLADAIGRIASRAMSRIEDISKSITELDVEQQAILDELEFGYATLNSLEAYLLSLAEQPPATSPRLAQAEAKVRSLESERTSLVEEQGRLQQVVRTLEEEDAPARQGREAQLRSAQTQAAALADQIATATAELDVARREAADAESDLRAFETWSQPANVVTLIEDYRLIRESGGADLARQITQAEAKAAKEAEIARLQEEETVIAGELQTFLPPNGLQKGPKYGADGTLLSPGLLSEEGLASLERWLPDTPEQPWLSEFIDNFAAERGMALDEAADLPGAADDFALKGQLTVDQYLVELARRYAMLKEAEAETLRATKKSIKKYREEAARQAQDEFENSIDRSLETGMGVAQIERVFKMVQEGPEATRARYDDATRRVARLEADIEARRTSQRGLQEEARQLEPGVRTPIPGNVGIRLSQISRRLREIDRSLGRVTQGQQRLGPARRSVEFARRAEPAEAARAERAKLKGVGRALRPEPGAEGPRGAQILRGVRTAAERRIEKLEGREAANLVVRRRLQTDQQRLANLEDQALTIREQAVGKVGEQMERPFGPQRLAPTTRTTYMPGGMTGNVRNARNVAVEMRSAGAAPQMKTQAELARFTGIQPLSLEETSLKIGEITNAYNRHVIVEEILQDPMATTNAATLLTQERVEAIRTEAVKRVAAQTRTPTQGGLLRSTPESMDAAVRQEFGRLLSEEIDRAGYEPVSRVDVDPETGIHEAVGNLLSQVPPESVDEFTFLMRKGLAQRIVQQFETIGQRNVPESVAAIGERIGQATGAWKTVVLPFSLRWQIGDLAGNVLNAWVLGDISPNVLYPRILETAQRLDTDRKMLMDATEMIADPLIEALQGAGLQGRGTKMSSVAALRDPLANPRAAIDDIRMMFGPLKGLRKTMFKFNEFQNVVVRTAFAIEKLDNILRARGRSIEEVTPQSLFDDPELADAIRQAVADTHKALGAFSEMSPWERRVIRQVFPFWAWVKFINKAAFNLAIDNPDRVLFMVGLGNMVADPDDSGFFSFLQGLIPVAGYYSDLGFVSPYSDAIIFGENPFAKVQETLQGVSPVIRTPLKATGLGFQYLTGWQSWPFEPVSQPSYLEGRDSKRSASILAGEIAYLALKDWGGPARNILESLPSNIPIITSEGRIRGTDVAVGPGPRFAQGSLRTGRSVYSQPRLSPTAQRVGAFMRALGIPGAPVADVDIVRKQARLQNAAAIRSKARKEREWRQSR